MSDAGAVGCSDTVTADGKSIGLLPKKLSMLLALPPFVSVN